MRGFKISGLVVMAAMCLVACNSEPTLDASNHEDFLASLERIEAALPDDASKQRFNEVLKRTSNVNLAASAILAGDKRWTRRVYHDVDGLGHEAILAKRLPILQKQLAEKESLLGSFLVKDKELKQNLSFSNIRFSRKSAGRQVLKKINFDVTSHIQTPIKNIRLNIAQMGVSKTSGARTALVQGEVMFDLKKPLSSGQTRSAYLYLPAKLNAINPKQHSDISIEPINAVYTNSEFFIDSRMVEAVKSVSEIGELRALLAEPQ